MPERWRPVVGYEGYYEVSNEGRLRSVNRVVPHGRNGTVERRSQLLRPSRNEHGYLIATLCRDGGRYAKTVHSILLEAFIGPRPDGLTILHGNDDPADNRLSNLRYGTQKENCRETVLRGRNANTKKQNCGKCGRPFDYVAPRGYRGCSTCRREAARRYRARKGAAV